MVVGVEVGVVARGENEVVVVVVVGLLPNRVKDAPQGDTPTPVPTTSTPAAASPSPPEEEEEVVVQEMARVSPAVGGRGRETLKGVER